MLVTGRATGGMGRSALNGSNGPLALARVYALVFPRAPRLSKSNEQTRASEPTP